MNNVVNHKGYENYEPEGDSDNFALYRQNLQKQPDNLTLVTVYISYLFKGGGEWLQF